MIYINRRQGQDLATVAEYPNYREAINALPSFKKNTGAYYYVATRCDMLWKRTHK